MTNPRALTLAVCGGSATFVVLTALQRVTSPVPPPLVALLTGLVAVLGGVAGVRWGRRSPPEPVTGPAADSRWRDGGFTIPGRVCLVLTEEQVRRLQTLAEMRAEGGSIPDGGVDQETEAGTDRKEPPGNAKPLEFPKVVCMKCGKRFEQTIRGRQLCPDCWSFEEYISKPVKAPGGLVEPPAPAAILPQPTDQLPDPGAITWKFRKAPALLTKFRFLARHQGTSPGAMAKDLDLARTTVRDAIDELRKMGLAEVGEDSGVRLTEFGEQVARESLPQVASGSSPSGDSSDPKSDEEDTPTTRSQSQFSHLVEG